MEVVLEVGREGEEDGVRDRGREEEKGGEGKRGKGQGKRDCNIN